MKRSSLLLFLSLSMIVALSACGSNGGFGVLEKAMETTSSPSETVPDHQDDSSSGGSEETGELGICSGLSLSGVTWPSSLALDNKRSMALGLNISGSFEGDDGWANLTNNFDNMGISLGLLNQNLGSGSLQPLWIKMRDRYGTNFKALFTSSHHSSLLSMLTAWESGGKSSLISLENSPSDGRLSLLDESVSSSVSSLSNNEDESVDWALSNLYTDDAGESFQSTWKSELLKLASHPDYVSLQIEAALDIHTKAMNYMTTLNMTERRSYLFLFDIVVQNGGLYSADIEDYESYFGSSSPTETARLKKILELRLAHVKSEYKSDVKARKNAIINGVGTVHGTQRDFEKEYCYDGSIKI